MWTLQTQSSASKLSCVTKATAKSLGLHLPDTSESEGRRASGYAEKLHCTHFSIDVFGTSSVLCAHHSTNMPTCQHVKTCHKHAKGSCQRFMPKHATTCQCCCKLPNSFKLCSTLDQNTRTSKDESSRISDFHTTGFECDLNAGTVFEASLRWASTRLQRKVTSCARSMDYLHSFKHFFFCTTS